MLCLLTRVLGRMVTRLTYGATIWEELGDSLAQWNTDAMQIFSQALFAFWPVDILPLRKFYHYLFRAKCLIDCQYVSSRAGSQVFNSSALL
jgi:hypothetical protein